MNRLLVASLIALVLSGCVSMPLNLSVPPNLQEGKDYTVLGEGEGSSVGIMLFTFIPIKQNQRFQNAYDEAVKSKGGDRLMNPTIEERWFWAYVLNGYIFKVKGTVVKDMKPGEKPMEKPATN